MDGPVFADQSPLSTKPYVARLLKAETSPARGGEFRENTRVLLMIPSVMIVPAAAIQNRC
jgi:hypothetical protein